jgi:hypothetical protein
MQGKWWKLICLVLLVGVIIGVATFAGRHVWANADEAELASTADGCCQKAEAMLDDDDDDDEDDEDEDDEDEDDDDDDDDDDATTMMTTTMMTTMTTKTRTINRVESLDC